MCQGGQVRSVGLKFLLRYKYGHDVIACGYEANTPETLAMLFEWAEQIIILQPGFIEYVHKEYKWKTICYDVGPDNYGNPFHPGLQAILDGLITQHGFFNRKVNK